MPTAGLKEVLRLHACADAMEEAHRERMQQLLQEKPDCFLRTCFPGHFTASALVLSHDRQKTLLTHHRALDRWFQFGGHCDGDADTLRGALREAEEESGVAGLQPDGGGRPIDLDIHAIPANARRGEPEHEHFDVRYVLIAPLGATPCLSAESKELRWFTPDEMLAINGDPGLVRLVEKWNRMRSR